MPTYMLVGAGEIRLNNKPLRFEIRLEGGMSAATLEITSGGRQLPTLVRPVGMPHVVILPQVQGQTLVSVVPVGVQRFQAPAIAHLAIVVEDPSTPDPQRVFLGPIDLSGLDRKDLLQVTNDAGGLSVRAAHNQSDVDLGPLGNASRVAARELLDVQWLGEGQARNVVLAVDGSASMTSLLEDGSVADMLSVLAGISQVVGNGKRISAAVVDTQINQLPASELAELSASTSSFLQERIPSSTFAASATSTSGAALGASAGSGGQGSNDLIYLVTDSVPADAATLAASTSAGGHSGETRHVVALSDPMAWRLLGGMSAPSTVVAGADAQESLSARLLRDQQALLNLVRSLLVGAVPAAAGSGVGA